MPHDPSSPCDVDWVRYPRVPIPELTDEQLAAIAARAERLARAVRSFLPGAIPAGRHRTMARDAAVVSIHDACRDLNACLRPIRKSPGVLHAVRAAPLTAEQHAALEARAAAAPPRPLPSLTTLLGRIESQFVAWLQLWGWAPMVRDPSARYELGTLEVQPVDLDSFATTLADLAAGVARFAPLPAPARPDPKMRRSRGRRGDMGYGEAKRLVEDWAAARRQGTTRAQFCRRRAIELTTLETAQRRVNRAKPRRT